MEREIEREGILKAKSKATPFHRQREVESVSTASVEVER